MTEQTAEESAQLHADALERVIHVQDLMHTEAYWPTADYQIKVTGATYDPKTHEVVKTAEKGWSYAELVPYRDSTLWVTRHGVVQVDEKTKLFMVLDMTGLELLETEELHAIAELVMKRFERYHTAPTE